MFGKTQPSRNTARHTSYKFMIAPNEKHARQSTEAGLLTTLSARGVLTRDWAELMSDESLHVYLVAR